MTNFQESWLPQFLEDFQKLQTDEKEVLTEAERLEIVNKATIVLCEVMLDGDKVVAQITENKRLFLRFTNGNQKAQKYLIGGIECLIAAREALLLPKVSTIKSGRFC